MVVSIGLVIGMVACAVLALRAARLLIAALWLACTSALLSVLLYMLGAPEIAVIELSVGAGLVTVLFVFALNLIGEEKPEERFVIPKPVSLGLVLVALLLIGALVPPLSHPDQALAAPEPSFSIMLWQQRGVDVLVQVALIFAGVLGVLGLLSGVKPTREPVVVELPESEATEDYAYETGEAVVDAPVVEEEETAKVYA